MKRYKNYKRARKERKGYHIRRSVYSNEPEKNSQIHYPTNYVSTTKYNIITFIPKNLFEQFHRIANIFFVFIMILTLTPISPVIPGPQVAAVAIIILFQMIKDAVEDVRRLKADRFVNAKHCIKLEGGAEQDSTWAEIHVGDILKVENNTEIPADMLLLSSTREGGQCFVETANLDGETNLKLRTAHPTTAECKSVEQLLDLKIVVDADEPCARLYDFDGSIVTGDGSEELPLSIESFLHRGTMLRNTEYVYGLVLYTGHQTKFMLNVAAPRHKMSKLERILNICIIGLLVILVFISFISSIIGTVVYEYDISEDAWYIIFDDQNGVVVDTFLNFLTFLVVYANLIPLSLYVNLEIIRLIQARFLIFDRYMYDKNLDSPCEVRATNLMEELGQIDWIFSDKTGTLTKNEMVFKVFTAGSTHYGEIPDLSVKHDFDEEEYLADAEAKNFKQNADEQHVEMEDMKGGGQDVEKVKSNYGEDISPEMAQVLRSNDGSEQCISLNDMMLHLVLCNTVLPTIVKGQRIYQASSPDEAALVDGAKQAGFVLVKRTIDEAVIEVHGEAMTFETLAVNEFTSTRRRMSVIVRFPDGSIRLLLKGADEAVFQRTKEDDPHLAYSHDIVDKFAAAGLRTLVMSQRILSEAEFDSWAENEWNVARLAVQDRKGKLAAAAEMVEIETSLVGCTGIEDKLQDAVSETIEDLLAANIKVSELEGKKKKKGRRCSSQIRENPSLEDVLCPLLFSKKEEEEERISSVIIFLSKISFFLSGNDEHYFHVDRLDTNPIFNVCFLCSSFLLLSSPSHRFCL
tara:strand:+ start:195 stop:2600 length:2406 start_codon:yes stop_codon:yes gene_type:complete